jgi:transposase
MKITTIGVDLAKNVFQVHGVDERGKTVLRKQLRRAQVAAFFANLPPCVIGMEACASAHYWGRTLTRFGHTVRPMASQFVKPYVKTNKNDAADAEAICEAVGRANMRFVPIKSIEQQAILPVHRVRQGFVKARTAQANQIRGLLGEFGLTIPQGHGARSAILAAQNKVDNTNGWLSNLLNRRHPNIAAVALANKNVRTVWALLAHGREFRADYAPQPIAA